MKPAPQSAGRSAAKSAASAPVEYQIATPNGIEAISQPFATLAGAKRALAKIRLLHPDAYITSMRGGPADRPSS